MSLSWSTRLRSSNRPICIVLVSSVSVPPSHPALALALPSTQRHCPCPYPCQVHYVLIQCQHPLYLRSPPGRYLGSFRFGPTLAFTHGACDFDPPSTSSTYCVWMRSNHPPSKKNSRFFRTTKNVVYLHYLEARYFTLVLNNLTKPLRY